MIPDSHRDLLEGRGFAHVATIGPDGEPQSNPVWVHWDGEYARFSQTDTRQKYHNVMKRDSRVALSVLDFDNPYRYLEVRGRVVRVDEDPDNASSTSWPTSTWAWTPTPPISRATGAWSWSSSRSTPP